MKSVFAVSTQELGDGVGCAIVLIWREVIEELSRKGSDEKLGSYIKCFLKLVHQFLADGPKKETIRVLVESLAQEYVACVLVEGHIIDIFSTEKKEGQKNGCTIVCHAETESVGVSFFAYRPTGECCWHINSGDYNLYDYNRNKEEIRFLGPNPEKSRRNWPKLIGC